MGSRTADLGAGPPIAGSRASGTDHALVLRHVSLVRQIALRFARRIPRHVELDDLVQAGMVGLLEAVERFTPVQGASFATFAAIRVRGAIVDYVRKTDWSTRSLRRRSRDIDEAKHRIQNAKGAVPKSAEVAAALGMTLKRYHDTVQGAAMSEVLSLDAATYIEKARVGDASSDIGADPAVEAEQAELRRAVADAIDNLPESERAVVLLYFHDELMLRNIGEKLGLSESRICQIRGKAFQRLRASLNRWTPAGGFDLPVEVHCAA
jgi:RNA polymerase sigma factor for flagellar operon FliA